MREAQTLRNADVEKTLFLHSPPVRQVTCRPILEAFPSSSEP